MQKPAFQNVQNVTLNLTLPISCQICLGKVRHPVICSNNHVFCFTCMESWLKNSAQCPTCRTPITSENPYKEVLGGSDGTENCDSSSIKRSLRKTRLELLHKEYEEEIESLQKEIEELRGKNLSLESQLKTVLDPVALPPGGKDDGEKQSPSKQSSASGVTSQQEWRAKLKAATEIYEKTKVDLDKLKQANQKLRIQNGDLVRENLHLKAEVESRSPQKFGRFTVAALQSKVEQCEREISRLKRALERSDKYIEDMEFQLERLRRKCEQSDNKGGRFCSESPSGSGQLGENGSGGDLWDGHNDLQEKRIMALRRSLSEIEQSSLSRLENAESPFAFSSHRSTSQTACESIANKQAPADNGVLATASVANELHFPKSDVKDEERTLPANESVIQFELPSPCTPSMSLGGLHLDSTDDEASPLMKRRDGDKKLGYLRRLCFDDARWRNACFEEQILSKPNANVASESLMFWDCQSGPNRNAQKNTLGKNFQTSVYDDTKLKAEMPDLICSPVLDGASHAENNGQRSRTSSETSMDAAYREKVSELDFMLDETENTQNPQCSVLSQDLSDLDVSLSSDLVQCTELLNEAEKRLEQKMRQNQLLAPASDIGDQIKSREKNAVSLLTVSSVTSSQKEETSEDKRSFPCSFSSPFLSVPSELSVLPHKKPSLWNNYLTAESEPMLEPVNRCLTIKRKPPSYGEDLSSPSKSSKKDFLC
ncbi:ORC ubiquitin ligase 1 isoform X1 [Hypanus sabinus]|uniref:ORC ubiquitin ligase 1 isoform X1 n=1 Tax=Hypanus sabinus TaxID=79690 RepID=UPI0028C3DF5B|nr:ORC ubiquitin ligase 1 isoform X1 [Hypanus sabinus]